MKTICLYFQVHQPFRFKRYRFFDIGNTHYYYDDYTNESVMRKMASKSYLPTNKLLLDLFKEYGSRFKVAFSISGTALDQFALYAPDVLESFKKLAQTGCVEFLSETNSHSLVSLKNKDEFVAQVKEHDEKIFKYFKQNPSVFRNTELIYNNEIGEWLSDIGYNAAITEGAKHILGWKSPNYIYCSATNPRLKLILKNYRLSDDIAFRFSDRGWNEFPLTAEKFINWIKALDSKEETVNLFMNYETFGSLQTKESGIFDFLKALPKFVLSTNKLTFSFPSELIEKFQPVAPLFVPYTISWADEERDVSAWLGNELQQEAFSKLYSLRDKVIQINDDIIRTDWKYLQTSDHFYYMCTKFFIHGSMHSYYNPFSSPYDAFINYMNILSDFEIRVEEALNPKEILVTTAPVRSSRTRKPASSKADIKAEKTQAKTKADTAKKTTSKSSPVTQKAKQSDVKTMSTKTGKTLDPVKKEKPASKKAAKVKSVSKSKDAKTTIAKKIKPTTRKTSNKTAVIKPGKTTEKKK
jgi:alpha-amylase